MPNTERLEALKKSVGHYRNTTNIGLQDSILKDGINKNWEAVEAELELIIRETRVPTPLKQDQLGRLLNFMTSDEPHQQFLLALKRFKDSAYDLSNAWDEADHTGDFYKEDYPFEKSLDDIVRNIHDWYDTQTKERS